MSIRAVENRKPRDEGGDLREAILAAEAAALVTDAQGHITSWNHAASRLFGRQAGQALGRRCYDIVGGRDVFGNRFCSENCAVMSMCGKGETVHSFEISVALPLRAEQPVQVSVFQSREGSATQMVHTFEPIDGTTRLARALERIGVPGAAATHLPAGPTPCPHEARGTAPPLTTREQEILRWVAAGLQNKEIAERVGISLATVRNHIHNLLEKLEVHSKLEAVSLAFRMGWVAEPQTGRAQALWGAPRR